MTLAAEQLVYRAGGQDLLARVSVVITPGRVHAIIGPNGAGKSTLLKLLAGDLLPHSGGISLNRRALSQWSIRDRARVRAVLPQSENLRFGFSARHVVQLGRLSSGELAPEREREIIDAALAAADAMHLAERRYPTLSGGERARVQFARVLAQIWLPVELGERYLLLDEPTASLDLAHQHHCLAVARRFARDNVGVLAVLHDPNLAMQYADEVTLLCCGQQIASGAPAEVLTPENLKKLYGVDIEMLKSSDGVRSYIAVGGAR